MAFFVFVIKIYNNNVPRNSLADVHQPNDKKKVTTEILNKKKYYVHFNDLFYEKKNIKNNNHKKS